MELRRIALDARGGTGIETDTRFGGMTIESVDTMVRREKSRLRSFLNIGVTILERGAHLTTLNSLVQGSADLKVPASPFHARSDPAGLNCPPGCTRLIGSLGVARVSETRIRSGALRCVGQRFERRRRASFVT